jgi:Domain of unknown function (DUF4168)
MLIPLASPICSIDIAGWRKSPERYPRNPVRPADARGKLLAAGIEASKEANMRLSMRSLALAGVTAAWSLSALPIAAQAPSPSQERSGQNANVSDEKLDATAAAMRSVAGVKADYQQRLASAPDSDREGIVGEAENALKKAVTDQGLSVEEYSSILRVAENDAGVRDKLIERIRGRDNR